MFSNFKIKSLPPKRPDTRRASDFNRELYFLYNGTGKLRSHKSVRNPIWTRTRPQGRMQDAQAQRSRCHFGGRLVKYLIFLAIILRSIIWDPTHAVATSFDERFQQAVKLENERKYNEAIVIFKDLIQINKHFISAYIELARSFVLLGKRTEGLKQLEDAIPFAKKHSEKMRIKEQRRLLSEIFYTNNTFQKYQDGLNNMKGMKLRAAIEAFEQALAQEPDNVEILTAYAKALQAVDDWKESTHILEKAFALNPDRKETRILLATVLLQNNHDRSLQLLAPLQADPNKTENTGILYAQALAKKGALKDAIQNLQKDVDHKPEWIRSHYWLGKFSSELPDNNWIARKHLQTFLRRIDSQNQDEELKFLAIEAQRILNKIQVNLGLETTR